jgi:hypothetical protein
MAYVGRTSFWERANTMRFTVIKTILAASFVAILAAPPASAADCISKYDDFWEKLQRHSPVKPSTEDLIAVNRAGIRAFDGCQAGDEVSDREFWDNLSRYGRSKDDAKKFFEDLSRFGRVK